MHTAPEIQTSKAGKPKSGRYDAMRALMVAGIFVEYISDT